MEITMLAMIIKISMLAMLSIMLEEEIHMFPAILMFSILAKQDPQVAIICWFVYYLRKIPLGLQRMEKT